MVGSKVIAFTNRYSCLARQDLLLTVYGFHIHCMEKGPPETPLKFWSRSNDRIYSYGPFEPLLLLGATRPPCHRVSIPHPLYVKGHPDIVKNLRRGQTVTVRKWTVTVGQHSPSICWWAILTTLEAELGSSQNIELVASCLIFPTP